MTHCPGCGETFGVQVPPASVRESGLMAERDRYREALERIAAIADPYPAEIARDALNAEPRREQSS